MVHAKVQGTVRQIRYGPSQVGIMADRGTESPRPVPRLRDCRYVRTNSNPVSRQEH